MSKISLIIENEYMTRVRKKSFLVMTLLTPVLMALLCCIPLFIELFSGSDMRNVTIADQTGLYREVFVDNDEYTYTYLDTETSSEQMRSDESPYAYIVITDNLLNNPNAMTIYSHKQTTAGFESEVERSMENFLHEAKLASYDIPGLQQIIDECNVEINVSSIRFDEEGDTQTSAGLATAIGMISTFIIYIFLFSYGGMVMNSVMQEKTNRIVEVMVSSVKPFDLMMGKIISVGLVGLTQIGIWIILLVGLALGASVALGIPLFINNQAEILTQVQSMSNTAMAGSAAIDPDMLDIAQTLSGINFTQIVVCLILYFIGGYVIYASIFAAVGSAVDNETDSSQFMLPITLIILFAFYVGIFSAEDPEGSMAWWCSMIPFTSPIVMMVRIPFGVATWELALSLVILYASAIGMTWIASRIYRVGILLYGKKPSYKELFKWIKYKA
ncbi:MAG: ABC transporter permease [Bacteroidaceae bacterium]|nr:ABC transporter permease [Bacteroidaceae bacterium]